jgi:hypothetical protein
MPSSQSPLADAPNSPPATEVADWYELDAQNRIVGLSPNWERTAAAGGAGDGLARERIVGESFFRFLAGAPTRMFHEAVFQAVRLTRQSRRIAYRCDTPELRRTLDMVIIPSVDGGLRIEHHVTSAEPRGQHAHTPERLTQHARRVGLWHRCAVCLKLNAPGRATWLEPDGLEAQLTAQNAKVQYTVCRHCWGAQPNLPKPNG